MAFVHAPTVACPAAQCFRLLVVMQRSSSVQRVRLGMLACTFVLAVGTSRLPAASAAWRLLSQDDYSTGTSDLTVVQPTELASVMKVGQTSVAGQLFPAEAPDYLFRAQWRLPHSQDMTHAGCDPFTHTTNDEGENFEGAFVIVERGGCSFSDKVRNAAAAVAEGGQALAGVIIYGCPTCSFGMIPLAANEDFPVPGVYVSNEDGQAVQTYLLKRRASYAALTVDGVLTQPVVCNEALHLQSSAAAAAAGCVLPSFEGTLIGTGELVDPAEKQALIVLAGALTFDESFFNHDTWLRPWSDLIEHPELDPCTHRITGMWCEAGHVTSFDLGGLGISGTLPVGSLAALSRLQFFIFLANYAKGAVPADFCQLTNLLTIQLDNNAFTSLPECLGGGTFSDGPEGAPVTYPGTLSLVYFAASNNHLTNLPASMSNLQTTLRTFAAFNNKIDQEFPIGFLQLHDLRLFELMNNPLLRLDWDAVPAGMKAPVFSNLTQVYSLLMSNTGFRGHLPAHAFDGMGELVTVAFSGNELKGELPTFHGCAKLNTIALRQNRLVGGIPSNWPGDLPALHTISLQKNALGQEPGSLDTMTLIASLKNIFLSNNNITSSIPTDVGESFFNMMPIGVVQVYLDNNTLTGPWMDGYLTQDQMRVLNVAHNRIETLPPDLWQAFVSQADFSFNALSGVLPAQSPSVFADPVTKRPAVTQFSIEGNPGIRVEELPGWMKYSDPPRYALSTDGVYLCRTLNGASESLRITADPTFTNYKECQCVRGSFGVPPLCPLLPQSALLSPYQLPESTEIGADFIAVIDWNVHGQFVLPNDTTQAPFVQYPDAFSDAWYGTNRFTSGMGTHWDIDLSHLLIATAALANETNTQVTVLHRGGDSTANTTRSTSLDDPFQSVRVITMRIHISRADFATDSTVSVYAGDIAGERVGVVNDKDRVRLNSLPTSSAFTSMAAYQAAYGSLIANLTDPVLLEVQVLSPRATLSFDSRSASGVHFVASYSYSFKCPEGYELPFGEDPTQTASCVQPTLGTASSVLILLLGIGGALVAFAFVWLMYERVQRQKAAQLLRSQSTIAKSSDGASDEDLQSDAARMYRDLQQMAYQRLVKEIVFEVASLLWEVTSTILNWVVVGQVLAEGTSNLSSLSVGYIIVVVISTFAVGANAVSRVMGLLQLRAAVQQEVALMLRAQRMSTENAGVAVETDVSSGSSLEQEADARMVIAEVTRKLLRLKIAALSLVLHAIPFILLNLVTLYDDDGSSARSSNAVTVQVSLLMSFLIIGMKLQDMKDWPNQQRLLALNELKIVQIRLATLHSGSSRHITRRTRVVASVGAKGDDASSDKPSSAAPATRQLADAPMNDEAVRSPHDAVLDVDADVSRPGALPPPHQRRQNDEDAMEMTTL